MTLVFNSLFINQVALELNKQSNTALRHVIDFYKWDSQPVIF